MVLAQLMFSSNIFMLRVTERVETVLSGATFHLSAWEPMFYRSVALSVWCLASLWRDPGERPSGRESLWLWIRGIVGVLSLSAYYYGVLHIPLGMASLFSNSSPLYVTLLAILFTGEKVAGLRLVSVIFGFLGVALVAWGALKDTASIAGFDVIIAAISGPMAALAYFSIRQLKRIKNEQIMLSLGLGGVLLSAGVLVLRGWHPPVSASAHGVLIASVIPAVAAQYCLTRAFRLAPASQVSPLQYMGPVFSSVYGNLFLDESLPHIALFGVVVVLLFGLVVPYIDAIAKRERAPL